MMEMSENTKFQNTAGSDILIAKSGISNHAASNILDDLCFSKFGTFHGGCPQSADNLRTFVCAPCWHQKVRSLSAVCRTLPVNCPNAERHRIRCSMRHGRNTRILLQRIAVAGCIWNLLFSVSPYKTYAVLCFRNPAVIFPLRNPAGVSCCRTCRRHFPDAPVQTECPHLPAVHRVCNTSVRYAG